MRCFGWVVLLCFHQALGRYVPMFVNVPSKLPRQDFIGSWIQSSEWFPIEVNIPDTISAIGNGLSTGFMNFSDAFGMWIQGLPFINRITARPTQFKPRPEQQQHLWFVPMRVRGDAHFNPFDRIDNNIVPMYP